MVEKPLKPWGSSTFSEISKRKKVDFDHFYIWSLFGHFLDPFWNPSIRQIAPLNASLLGKKGSKKGVQNVTSFFDPFFHPYAESTEKVPF